MSDTFDTNLFRLTAAAASTLVTLAVARELFGKSYFALGIAERAIVDRNAFEIVAAQYQSMTPERFGGTPSGTMGFQPPPQIPPTS